MVYGIPYETIHVSVLLALDTVFSPGESALCSGSPSVLEAAIYLVLFVDDGSLEISKTDSRFFHTIQE